jgi:hypothetical protein
MLRVEKGEQVEAQKSEQQNKVEQVKTLFQNLLPYTDYGQTIEHTKNCIICLETNVQLKANRVQLHGLLNSLKQKPQENRNKINDVRESLKSLKEDLEASDAQYDLMIREAELNRHKKILRDQQFHFDNNFRARMYAEFKVCREQALITWEQAVKTVGLKKHKSDLKLSISNDLKKEIDGFGETYPNFKVLFTDQKALDETEGETDTKAIETVNTTFKNLQRLIVAYQKAE